MCSVDDLHLKAILSFSLGEVKEKESEEKGKGGGAWVPCSNLLSSTRQKDKKKKHQGGRGEKVL